MAVTYERSGRHYGEDTIQDEKLAIGLTLTVVAVGATLATAGWGGWGWYSPSYTFHPDHVSNWPNVDARANVNNVVVADTSGVVGRYNRPAFNLYIDQHSDIDIATDVNQRNHDDDCGCGQHGSRWGVYDYDRMSNWSDVDSRANVSNTVIADTSGLMAGANKPRFNLYIDQHSDIDI